MPFSKFKLCMYLFVFILTFSKFSMAAETYELYSYQPPEKVELFSLKIKQKLDESLANNGLKFVVLPHLIAAEQRSYGTTKIMTKPAKALIMAFQNVGSTPLLLHLNWTYQLKANPTLLKIIGHTDDKRKRIMFEEPLWFAQLTADKTQDIMKIAPNTTMYFIHELQPLLEKVNTGNPKAVKWMKVNEKDLKQIPVSIIYSNNQTMFCSDHTSDACIIAAKGDLTLPVWVGEITSNQIYFK